MSTTAADPLARQRFSRSASSTYHREYACVVLTFEKRWRTSVSAALRRHSWRIRAWATARSLSNKC